MEALSNGEPWYAGLSCLVYHDIDVFQIDTMKLYTKAHGAKVGQILRVRPLHAQRSRLGKTTNLIINLDRDDWILDDDSKFLVDVGFGELQ